MTVTRRTAVTIPGRVASKKKALMRGDEDQVDGDHQIVEPVGVFPLVDEEDGIFNLTERQEDRGNEQEHHHPVAPPIEI